MEKKPSRVPTPLKVILSILALLLDIVGVIIIFLIGFANLAVAFGMVFTVVIWPLLLNFGTQRLYTIRREYVEAVRADGTPTFSLPRVLGLYALIFSPPMVYAWLSFALPWSIAASGIFFVPSVVLTIVFGMRHSSVWLDIGLRRCWYILYLAALIITATLLGVLLRVLA